MVKCWTENLLLTEMLEVIETRVMTLRRTEPTTVAKPPGRVPKFVKKNAEHPVTYDFQTTDSVLVISISHTLSFHVLI